MTEAEWMASNDPAAMLSWLAVPHVHRPEPVRSFVTDRKLRLFVCACCRAVWPLLTDPRSRRAVEVAESFADGEATLAEYMAADDGMEWVMDSADAPPSPDMAAYNCVGWSDDVTRHVVYWVRHWLNGLVSPAAQAALLRCIFGDPFRPVKPDWRCVSCGGRNVQQFSGGRGCGDCYPRQGFGMERAEPWLAWNGGAVRKMAQAIYDGRRFADLPLLADALEEASCADAAILAHCRGVERCPDCFDGGDGVRVYCDRCGKGGLKMGWIPFCGPHVRGCWVIDLLTGRE